MLMLILVLPIKMSSVLQDGASVSDFNVELCPLINVFKVISIPGVFCFSPPVNTCFTATKLFSVLQDGASALDFSDELCFYKGGGDTT